MDQILELEGKTSRCCNRSCGQKFLMPRSGAWNLS